VPACRSLFLVVVAWCSFATALPIDAHAQTEAQGTLLAQSLNLRYGKTVDSCKPGPAFYCSGVLVRSIPKGAGDATDPSPEEASRNVVALSYLRADAHVVGLPTAVGFVVPERDDALAQGQAYTAWCVYVFATSLGTRSDHGCGMPGAAASGSGDPGSCAALGIVDDGQWLKYFLDHNSDLAAQCSFSAMAPPQFLASVQSRRDPRVAAKLEIPNALIIRGWPLGYSAALPIQAFYYTAGNNDGRSAAMQYRKAYYTATALKVPVLRLDLSRTASVFAYDLADNPDHDFGHPIDENIANALNARYQDDKMDACPNGEPAFYCSGVLLRIVKPGGGFEVWDNSPVAHDLGSVSFGYIRRDMKISKTPWNGADGFVSGYIIHDGDSAANLGRPPTYHCFYPYDADTQGGVNPATDHGDPARKSAGCAPLLNPPAGAAWPTPGVDNDLATCPIVKLTTAAAWVADFAKEPHDYDLCSFSVIDAGQFAVALEAQRLLQSTKWANGWTEFLIKVWPDHSPDLIPIQAFFYAAGQAAGLPQAQGDQVDFCRATNTLIPIVKFDILAKDGNVFSYQRSDQLDCL
jgi:hypothetical protein